MHILRILTLSAILLQLSTGIATAQNGVNSPYSRYGFGVEADRAMGFNKGMDGVAQGFANGNWINTANPASYAAVDSLTALFDMGLSLQNGNYSMGGLQQNVRNSSLDYFAFQFRAKKHWGWTIALLPYTNINYSFKSSTSPIEGTESTTSYTFSGTGGLHQIMIGTGWQPVRNLSIGVNFAYLFGDYNHATTMAVNETSSYSLRRAYTADIATYSADFGLQYTLPLNKKDRLTLGITYGLGHDINNRAIRSTQTLSSSGTTQSATNDTIHNAFQLPHTISAGIAYRHTNRLAIGADFTYEKWGDCRFPAQEANTYASMKGQLNDRIRVTTGLSFTPFTPSTTTPKYYQRITYKLGAHYAQPYAKADGAVTDKPTEFGISAGLTLPIQNRNLYRRFPNINIAFQWVHSSIPYISATMLQQQKLTENYLRLSIGITFSELWFHKWKVQ